MREGSVGQSCPRSIIKGRSTDYFVLGDQQRLDLEGGIGSRDRGQKIEEIGTVQDNFFPRSFER